MCTHATAQSQHVEVSLQLKKEKCWYLWEKKKKSQAFFLFFLMISSAIKRHRATSTAGTNLSKSTDFDSTT